MPPLYDALWAFPDADVRQEFQKMMRTQVQQCTDGFMCLMCGKIVKRANHMRRHLKEQHMQAALILIFILIVNVDLMSHLF